MAKAKTKAAPKQYYVFGELSEQNSLCKFYETLEELDEVVGLCHGDTVTVIQVVGVKAVKRNDMELV